MEIGGFSYPLWIASAIPLATFALGALSWKFLGRWTLLVVFLGMCGIFLAKVKGG